MNCDSWEEPKNSFTAAVTGLMLIRDCGEIPVLILCGHSLADYSLQSGQTDSVLVLEQFSYRTDTSVAQMIDVVVISHSVFQVNVIVNRS